MLGRATATLQPTYYHPLAANVLLIFLTTESRGEAYGGVRIDAPVGFAFDPECDAHDLDDRSYAVRSLPSAPRTLLIPAWCPVHAARRRTKARGRRPLCGEAPRGGCNSSP